MGRRDEGDAAGLMDLIAVALPHSGKNVVEKLGLQAAQKDLRCEARDDR